MGTAGQAGLPGPVGGLCTLPVCPVHARHGRSERRGDAPPGGILRQHQRVPAGGVPCHLGHGGRPACGCRGACGLARARDVPQLPVPLRRAGLAGRSGAGGYGAAARVSGPARTGAPRPDRRCAAFRGTGSAAEPRGAPAGASPGGGAHGDHRGYGGICRPPCAGAPVACSLPRCLCPQCAAAAAVAGPAPRRL